MKVLLVNPPKFKGISVIREDRCESAAHNTITPTGLVFLAGMLEQKHQVELIDANGSNKTFSYIEERTQNFKPDVVVFKATPETFFQDVKTAITAKKVNDSIRTVAVCWSLTKIPHQVLRNCQAIDYYIIDSNYERPIADLCGGVSPPDVSGIAFRSGDSIEVNSPSKERFDFNSLPMPAWHLIPDFSVYWVQAPSISPHAFVESAKGCGLTCMFCTIANMPPTFREPKKVVDELEYLFRKRGVKYINFFDATFNISKKRAFDICEEIIRRDLKGLTWFANVRADRLDVEEAQIMKSAGCQGAAVGIESGSQKVLDLARKKQTVAQAEQTVNILKNAGIKQYLSFIVGLPGETLETLEETRRFILRAKPTGFQVNCFVPYPRSPLYDQAVELGKIDDELRPDKLLLYNTPISLCDLTVEEVNNFREKLIKQVYFDYGWWLSNVSWVVQHPSDIRTGFDYAAKIVRRVLKGIDSEI